MNANIILFVSIGCAILLAIWLALIELRLKKIFRGKKAGDLEEVLKNLSEDLKNLQISQEKINAYLKEAESRLQKSLKQIGIVRFNPFSESTGSNQSFSIAFLDEQGSGAVISTLYTRDNIKTYAKPIKEYKSEYSLTPEEEKAIWKTKQQTI